MNIALAASRDVDPVWAVSAALVVLNKANRPGMTVLLRRPRSKEPNTFEVMVSAGAKSLGIPTEWFSPPEEVEGRASSFLRDIAMIERSDLLLAFFRPERAGDGGTAHLVDKAIDKDIPVWSYLVAPGQLTRFGEHEPSRPVADEMREVFEVVRSLQGDYNPARDNRSGTRGKNLHTIT